MVKELLVLSALKQLIDRDVRGELVDIRMTGG
jgi:hypothetical protein